MKNLRWTFLAGLLVVGSGVAHAQAPVAPAAPSPIMSGPTGGATDPNGTGTTAAGAADTGAITNAGADPSTVSDAPATNTSSPGIPPEENGSGATASIETETTSTSTKTVVSSSSDESTLVNTGGEPILMSLLGLSMSIGAFAVRRRTSA